MGRAFLLLLFFAALAWWILPAAEVHDDFDLDSVFTIESLSEPLAETKERLVTPEMFAVQLWYTSPVVEAPEPVAPEPKIAKLRLQLIAIAEHTADTEASRLRSAILYDPDEDILLEVIAGQSIGRVSVIEILETQVRLSEGQRETVLSLISEEDDG